MANKYVPSLACPWRVLFKFDRFVYYAEFLRSHIIKRIPPSINNYVRQKSCRVCQINCYDSSFPFETYLNFLGASSPSSSSSIWSKIFKIWILAFSPGSAPSQYSPDGDFGRQLGQVHSNHLFLLHQSHLFRFRSYFGFRRNFNFHLAVKSVRSDVGSETLQNVLERRRIFARIGRRRKIFDIFLFETVLFECDKVLFVVGARVKVFELILKARPNWIVKSCGWIFCWNGKL